MAANEKVGLRHCEVHAVAMRIIWVKPQRTTQSLDRRFGFTNPYLDPTAEEPRPGEVGIERYGSVCQSHPVVVVSNEVSESPAGCSQSYGVIPAQLCRPPGKPSDLCYVNIT